MKLIRSMPGVPSATPAQENRASTVPPQASRAASIESRSARFTWTALTPGRVISAKSRTTTSAPASRTTSAVAAPIPVAPPTTRARLPSKRKASKVLTGAPSCGWCRHEHGAVLAGLGRPSARSPESPCLTSMSLARPGCPEPVVRIERSGASRWALRDLPEGDALVQGLLPRHAEDPLGHHVAGHLRRPAGDLADLAAQEAHAPLAEVGVVVGPHCGRGPRQLPADGQEPPPDQGVHELADRGGLLGHRARHDRLRQALRQGSERDRLGLRLADQGTGRRIQETAR